MAENKNLYMNEAAAQAGSGMQTSNAETQAHEGASAINGHRYEALYTELLDRGDQLHEGNKRRIRRGVLLLIILPFVLNFIRLITDSDKVVFLIIWIFIMFIVSAYLISIEYLDSAIEKTLKDVTDTEENFDGLVPKPELQVADLHERIRERIGELREDRLDEKMSQINDEVSQIDEEAQYIEEVIEHLEESMDETTAIAADAIALNHMDEIETLERVMSRTCEPASQPAVDPASGKEDE